MIDMELGVFRRADLQRVRGGGALDGGGQGEARCLCRGVMPIDGGRSPGVEEIRRRKSLSLWGLESVVGKRHRLGCRRGTGEVPIRGSDETTRTLAGGEHVGPSKEDKRKSKSKSVAGGGGGGGSSSSEGEVHWGQECRNDGQKAVGGGYVGRQTMAEACGLNWDGTGRTRRKHQRARNPAQGGVLPASAY